MSIKRRVPPIANLIWNEQYLPRIFQKPVEYKKSLLKGIGIERPVPAPIYAKIEKS